MIENNLKTGTHGNISLRFKQSKWRLNVHKNLFEIFNMKLLFKYMKFEYANVNVCNWWMLIVIS